MRFGESTRTRAASWVGSGISKSHAVHGPSRWSCRRHHVSDSVIQRAVNAAARKVTIHKPVSVHTLRHSIVTHLLFSGVDIRQIQEFLGHANVETTMVYTRVVKDLRNLPRSPLDLLGADPGL